MAFEPSPQQREILDHWGSPLVVVAGAGCGKTTTLVEKARRLIGSKPDARICAVSFTEKSAADLRERLSEFLDLGCHWVRTIHGLCSGVIRQFPQEAGLLGGERVVDAREADGLWAEALEAVWFGEWSDPGLREAWAVLETRETLDTLRGSLDRARALWFNGLRDFQGGSRELRAFLTLASHVMDRYALLKSRAGALDFQDLEVRAGQALSDERVRTHFHRAFDLVMIDEFQDTNPLQAELLWRFVRPDQSNLVVVGDPKQSIYGFREADVTVFDEKADEIMTRGKRLDLTVNRRSRPEILNYVNALCGKIFPRAELVYEPLESHREAARAGEAVVGELRAPQAGAGPQTLVAWLRSEVARGVPLSDFAILLRKVKGNLRWLEALREAGFPMAISSGGFFWDDVRVRELVALLKFWSHPGNENSAVTFFRAPWVGVPDRVIDDWMFSKPRDLKTAFLKTTLPLAEILRPLAAECVRPGQILEALLGDSDREREIGSQILGLWHRAEGLSAQGLTFHEVVSRFADAVEEGQREKEIPPPEGAGHLRVLTIHASKGLEFPRVILIDFPDVSRSDKTPVLFWDRKRGAEVAVMGDDGERNKDAPLEKDWRAFLKARALQESLRVFYVALTRAREQVVLVLEPTDRDLAAKTELWRTWVENEGPKLSRLVASSHEAAVARPSQAAPQMLRPSEKGIPRREVHRARHSVTEWLVLSKCPRQYEWTYIRPRFVPETQKALQEDDFSREGTRIHAEKAREVLSMANGRNRWPELSFEAPVDGPHEVLVGTLDLLEEDAGQFVLTDYKVTRAKKTPDELRDQYARQLELYAWAVNQLAPESRDRLQARILNIHDGQETLVEIPLPKASALSERARALLKEARAVLEVEGEPRPGSHCMVCPVRFICSNRAS